jgi:hypothetical protein
MLLCSPSYPRSAQPLKWICYHWPDRYQSQSLALRFVVTAPEMAHQYHYARLVMYQ